jgi:hypothetical protein
MGDGNCQFEEKTGRCAHICLPASRVRSVSEQKGMTGSGTIALRLFSEFHSDIVNDSVAPFGVHGDCVPRARDGHFPPSGVDTRSPPIWASSGKKSESATPATTVLLSSVYWFSLLNIGWDVLEARTVSLNARAVECSSGTKKVAQG